MTRGIIAEIFDILVDECGARESEREDFFHHWPECVEYRFQGKLGFGGKVFCSGGKVWVSCYLEDETPERNEIIKRANDRIAALRQKEDA
jgi:hypothetical protein